MSEEREYLAPPGEAIDEGGLGSVRGKAFAAALTSAQDRGFVRAVELRRVANPASDVVVFAIEPERPQHLKNDIRRIEMIAVVFRDDDTDFPEVLALRPDFPYVPHVNLRPEGFPRSLCIYDQLWSDERTRWTPTNFLLRIHTWLSKTADGTLHAADQPLEPFMLPSNVLLLVPPELENNPTVDIARPLVLTHCVQQNGQMTVIADWLRGGLKVAHNWICVAVKCTPSTHGVIRRVPRNLADLHAICGEAGLDLLHEIGSKIRNWVLTPPYANYQDSKLLLIVILPKTRQEGGDVESVETRSFLTFSNSIRDIGRVLGVTDGQSGVAGGAAGLILNPQKPDPNSFAAFELQSVEISSFLDSQSAAAMNGRNRIAKKMLAVGAGALGSQILSNMVKAGSDSWTIVDHDILKPHNLARHLLGVEFVGHDKATAVSALLSNSISPWVPPIRAIPANFFSLESNPDLQQATRDADLIFDFSASVAVARHLSAADSRARRISSFVSPSGNGLVILAEDAERTCTLEWLENIHYRLTLSLPELRDSLFAPGRLRTGATCRDMSFIIGQAELATWAGIFSRQIPKITESDKPAVKIFQLQNDDAISCTAVEPTAPISFRLGSWTVLFDDWLIESLERFRAKRLPNETGGILLGILDTQKKTCLLTDALPSPPDSTEWPASYIRGCKGLFEQMKNAENQTGGQVTYVGEWHSHPNEASVLPSNQDWAAYEDMKVRRDEECLPTLMFIIGDNHQYTFVAHSSAS